jgi:alkylhydroperoxidase family enzyme
MAGSGQMPADAFDAALLRTADELHRDAFVDDSTWETLRSRYSTEQLMDAVFTVAETSMLAMTFNSLRPSVDAAFTARAPREAPAEPDTGRDHTVLATPRIPPLEQTFWTGELRALLDPDATGREIAAVYRTFAQHPAMYRPRQELSEYIRLKSTLPDRVRELAILRIGYLCGSDYEWGAHARAGAAAGLSVDEIRRIASRSLAGWNSADALVLQAADELFARDEVGDATWSRLARQFDRRQQIDVLITIGGYRMVSMALNTFGVPLEPNSARLPTRLN